MKTVTDQVIAERSNSVNNIIENKTQKKQGPVIIAWEPEAGLNILGKNFLEIGKTMNEEIAFYPFVIIPKKRIIQVKRIDKKTDENQSRGQD